MDLTTCQVHDSRQLPEIFSQTLGEIAPVSDDKAYDGSARYEAIRRRGGADYPATSEGAA